jgi:hypothetical protein
MNPSQFDCSLEFAREFNPAFEALESEKRRKEVFRVRASRVVREFLYDHVRLEFPGLYPRAGVQPSWGYMATDSADLLVVEIYLPPHKDMARLTNSLQRLLIKRLLNELPELSQKLTVIIGPAKK